MILSVTINLLLQPFAMASVTASIPTVVSMMKHTLALRSLVEGVATAIWAISQLTFDSLYLQLAIVLLVVENCLAFKLNY